MKRKKIVRNYADEITRAKCLSYIENQVSLARNDDHALFFVLLIARMTTPLITALLQDNPKRLKPLVSNQTELPVLLSMQRNLIERADLMKQIDIGAETPLRLPCGRKRGANLDNRRTAITADVLERLNRHKSFADRVFNKLPKSLNTVGDKIQKDVHAKHKKTWSKVFIKKLKDLSMLPPLNLNNFKAWKPTIRNELRNDKNLLRLRDVTKWGQNKGVGKPGSQLNKLLDRCEYDCQTLLK